MKKTTTCNVMKTHERRRQLSPFRCCKQHRSINKPVTCLWPFCLAFSVVHQLRPFQSQKCSLVLRKRTLRVLRKHPFILSSLKMTLSPRVPWDITALHQKHYKSLQKKSLKFWALKDIPRPCTSGLAEIRIHCLVVRFLPRRSIKRATTTALRKRRHYITFSQHIRWRM